jgi:predicted DNA-binding transcriptional regulator YafY
MPERISKTQRWLDLIAFLVGRKVPVEVEQIMEAVPAYAERYVTGEKKARESVRRMFERDKDELRDLGIPIETLPLSLSYGAEEVDAYRLANRDFYLPYLRLISERGTAGPGPTPLQKAKYGTVEIGLADSAVAWSALTDFAAMPSFPFRSEAGSALRKLSFDLDPGVGVGIGGPPSVFYVDRPGAAEIRSKVGVLSDALLARKRVRFRYHGIQRGHFTDRDVAPFGLLYQQGHWYLIGEDAGPEQIRVFRVGRMDEPAVNAKAPKTPDYEIPPDFELESYRNRDAWELGGAGDPAIQAMVRFEFPTSLWAERNGYGGLERKEPDGSQIRSFEVRQVHPFLRWILGLEGRARIVEPPELGAELGGMARDVLAVYDASASAAASSGTEAHGGPDG